MRRSAHAISAENGHTTAVRGYVLLFQVTFDVTIHLTAISLTSKVAKQLHLGIRPPLAAVICYLNRTINYDKTFVWC